jgi:hypothetical protein
MISPDGSLLYRYVANPIYRYPAWDAVLENTRVAHTA